MRRNSKNKVKRTAAAVAIAAMITCSPIQVQAAGKFDPFFYMTTYADVAAAFGMDIYALYNHYITVGQQEGRIPYPGAASGEAVEGILGMGAIPETTPASGTGTAADTADGTAAGAAAKTAADAVPSANGIIPIYELQNYTSLKKNMTDAEFQAAYNAALTIVQPLAGLSQEEQVAGIMAALRNMVDSGQVAYSTSLPHYNDSYGYLVNHVASCAGSTRTTGLCLNMLGIPYEHVHENQWCHQWCRANLNGTIWIVDPYGYACEVEASPYYHPYFSCGQ